MTTVRGCSRRFAPEDAAVVKKAWKAAREELSTDGRFRGAVRAGPARREAVVAMAESYLANGPAARKDRYLAMIHVDADVLDRRHGWSL